MNKEFILHSDVEVFSIPDGEKILLKKGMPGIITQSLGDNFTIVVEGNMYQVKDPMLKQLVKKKNQLSVIISQTKKKFGIFLKHVMTQKYQSILLILA